MAEILIVFIWIAGVALGICLFLAPLYIWYWCHKTHDAVERNTMEMNALRQQIALLSSNLVQVAVNQQTAAEIVAGLHEEMPAMNENLKSN